MAIKSINSSKMLEEMREIALELYQKGVSAEDALPLIKNALRDEFPHVFGTPQSLCEMDAKILPFFSPKSTAK